MRVVQAQLTKSSAKGFNIRPQIILQKCPIGLFKKESYIISRFQGPQHFPVAKFIQGEVRGSQTPYPHWVRALYESLSGVYEPSL